MKSKTVMLASFDLSAIKEERGGTIFNPSNFLKISERMIQLAPEAQRQWGRMNVVQMLNHLKVATGSGINLYKLKDESSYVSRVLIKFLVVRLLKRIPRNAAGPKGFEIELNDALDFNREKEQVLIILEKAYTSAYDTYLHPLFGKMSRAEWGRLIYRHFDHHLRQFNS